MAALVSPRKNSSPPARTPQNEQAKALADRVLAFSRAEQARVNIGSGEDGNTRFAVNQISTAGDVTNASLTVTSAIGTKSEIW